MKITYSKLWKLLKEKNMKKENLKNLTKLSAATMAKLGKGANVNTDIIVRICEALDCDVCDIMEIEK